jgi:hypothetical protein
MEGKVALSAVRLVREKDSCHINRRAKQTNEMAGTDSTQKTGGKKACSNWLQGRAMVGAFDVKEIKIATMIHYASTRV